MTVNELIQKLVELARDGKGQYEVKINDIKFGFLTTENVGVIEENKEIVID